MKQSLLLLAVLTVCGVIFAQTDANVVKVQSWLKAEGFYSPNPSGVLDSETRAALTRYQIRHGLTVTGRLDAATVKELNASAPKPQPTPEALAGSWKRLPSGEMEFVQQPPPPAAASSGASSPVAVLSPPSAPPPAEIPAAAPSTTQTSTGPPAPLPAKAAQPEGPASGSETMNPESLRDYVEAFVQAGVARPQGSEIKFFADTVDYFGRANVSRQEIQRDLVRYNKKWPHRQFWIDGDIQFQQQQSGNQIKIVFPLRYQLRNGSRYASGRVLKDLTLVKTPSNEMQIVAVNERRAPSE